MMERPTYPRSRPTIDDTDIAAVTEVLRSGQLQEGTWVRKLEHGVARRLGKYRGQATSSGFSAIHVLLHALGIGHGDDVILPSYCCPSVLFPIKLTGARPVFADLGPDAFSPSVDTIAPLVTQRTKAILYPYLFGFPAWGREVVEAFPDAVVIEDVAQALGAKQNGSSLGSLAHHAVASFYASKLITGGDGGMILTDDERVYQRSRDLASYATRTGPEEMAFNYRLTNMNAALATSQLSKIDALIARRRQLAMTFDRWFDGSDKFSKNFVGREDSVFLRYPLLLEDRHRRPELMSKLEQKGVASGIGVLEALHVKEGERERTDLPRTIDYLQRLICLPIYPTMEECDVDYIAKATLEALS